LSLQPILALLALIAMFVGAFLAHRGERSRTALLLVIAAPLAAALVYTLTDLKGRPDREAGTPAPTASANTGSRAEPETSTDAVGAASGKVAALRSQAEEARRGKKFAQAAALFREITQAAPFDPDGWADLGDAQAAAVGGDLTAGQAAIDRALELDPRHAKALWLKASLELQAKRFAAAADLWRRLLKEIPADSSDAQIVKSNLDEAERLAGKTGSQR
jgi:cytochrome c-type biogenesis protein CcmH/NrfG